MHVCGLASLSTLETCDIMGTKSQRAAVFLFLRHFLLLNEAVHSSCRHRFASSRPNRHSLFTSGHPAGGGGGQRRERRDRKVEKRGTKRGESLRRRERELRIQAEGFVSTEAKNVGRCGAVTQRRKTTEWK